MDKEMRLHFLHVLLLSALIFFQCCTAKTGEPSDAVWLARSCVGEAGWNSWQTGECAAILHIYRKRATLTNETPRRLAGRYSAAIKKHSGKQNIWVLGLREDATRPENWPQNIKWMQFRDHWLMTLLVVELWQLGMVDDPTPAAVHYGCRFDTPPGNVKRLKTEFRNIFYELKK